LYPSADFTGFDSIEAGEKVAVNTIPTINKRARTSVEAWK
jgi:hypothetical protein